MMTISLTSLLLRPLPLPSPPRHPHSHRMTSPFDSITLRCQRRNRLVVSWHCNDCANSRRIYRIWRSLTFSRHRNEKRWSTRYRCATAHAQQQLWVCRVKTPIQIERESVYVFKCNLICHDHHHDQCRPACALPAAATQMHVHVEIDGSRLFVSGIFSYTNITQCDLQTRGDCERSHG